MIQPKLSFLALFSFSSITFLQPLSSNPSQLHPATLAHELPHLCHLTPLVATSGCRQLCLPREMMSRWLVKAPRISRIVKGHILWIRNEDAEPKCLPCKSLSVESFVTNSHRLRGLHRWFHDVNLRRACVPLPKVNGACTVQLATSPVHGGVSRLPVDLHNCRPWFCTVNSKHSQSHNKQISYHYWSCGKHI